MAARTNRLFSGAVLGAPLVLLGLVGWTHRWIFDDGFIYLRVVRQIRVGNGPVFNTGARVEAFTSPLWVAVLTLADLVTPLSLEWLAIVLGIGFSVLGCACAVAGAARLVRLGAPQEFLVPLGIVVFAALLPVWYFQTSGLETGLTFAWLGACMWVLGNWAASRGRRLSALGSIVIGLGWLVRPELVLDSVAFVVVVSLVQWRGADWRRRFELVAWALAIPVVYEVFRMGYYGRVVANPAIAKEGSLLRPDTGWSYLLDFAQPYRLWIPVTLLILGAYIPLAARLRQRRESRAVWVLVVFLMAAILNSGAVVVVGGDYVHGRLLLPAVFALCAPVAVIPVAARYLATVAVLGWALVCAIALRPPQARAPYGIVFRDGNPYLLQTGAIGRVTVSDWNWGPGSASRKLLRGRALFVVTTAFQRQYAVPDAPVARDVRLPTVVTGGIGALGYAVGPEVSILDVNGLADPLTAHLELVRRGYPGHEKVLPPPWIAARVIAEGSDPRSEDFPIRPSASTPPARDMSFASQVEWARAALRCSAIADLERSTERTLTPRSFFSNILHSFSRTRRRVPSDPRAAYLRFCSELSPEVGTSSREGRTRPPRAVGVTVGSALRSRHVSSSALCPRSSPVDRSGAPQHHVWSGEPRGPPWGRNLWPERC